MTPALKMRVGGQRHAPAALPPGKTRYPLYWRLGGPQGRSGRVRKILPPTGIRSPDRPARSESLYRLELLREMHNGALHNVNLIMEYFEIKSDGFYRRNCKCERELHIRF